VRSYGALAIALAVLAVFVYAVYEIQTSWSARSRLFALTITLPAIALALVQVARELRRLDVVRAVPAEANVARSALAWFAAFFASLWLIGLMTTVPLYAAAYLRFAAGEAWPKAVLYALAAWAFAYVLFVSFLHIPLPTGALTLPAAVP
jgi:hypothetical protein